MEPNQMWHSIFFQIQVGEQVYFLLRRCDGKLEGGNMGKKKEKESV